MYYNGERSHGDFGDMIFGINGELFRDGLVDKIFYVFWYNGELFHDGLGDEVFYYNGERSHGDLENEIF